MPRVRVTIRGLMLATAVAGVGCGVIAYLAKLGRDTLGCIVVLACPIGGFVVAYGIHKCTY